MILVIGGTGRLGSLLSGRLAQQGHEVRVLSRGLAPKSPLDEMGERVQRVVADVRDPRSIEEHVQEAETAVLSMHGFAGRGRTSPRTVDQQGGRNVIDVAARSGTDVVMLSIAGASATHPLELARVKYGVEQDLRSSGCRWTVVRSDAFAQTWLDILEQTAATSHRPLVFGEGANPIGWVDVREVASLVENAVVDPGLRGRILEISGPEKLTLTQLANLLMEHHGWPGTPRRIPRVILHVMATLAGPLRPDLARQARASLAMDVLPPTDDSATRAEFPDLPALPVNQLLTTMPVDHPGDS